MKSSKRFPVNAIRIGIDIDDVLADSAAYWISKVNRKFNLHLTRQDYTNIPFTDCEKLGDSSPQQIANYVYQLIFSPDFHFSISPHKGALRVIQNLNQQNAKIYFISNRPLALKAFSKKWLEDNGFWRYGHGFFHYNEWKNSKTSKKDLAQKLKLNYFVDDSHEQALRLSELDMTVFLFAQPWNREELNSRIVRVKNWEEIEQKLVKPHAGYHSVKAKNAV